MAVHTGSGRNVPIWLCAIAIIIFLWSFLHLSINLPSPQPQPSPEGDQVTRKRPSALDKEPLRIYVPPDDLPADTLFEIPGLHHETSVRPPTDPDEDSEEIPPLGVSPDEKECPVQPFDISQCPSVEHIAENPNSSPGLSSHNKDPDRPLILYAYSESDFGRTNLAFFINHGLHDAADFIFILNGETDVDTTVLPISRPNVRIIKRENICFDLGAHAEVLTKEEEQNDGKALKDMYKRFILMNASIRGPFVPHWSKECWSDAYLGRLNEKVKLVGSSLNCLGGASPHVQSMIWATDHVGLSIILSPAGINECFESLDAAIGGEMRTTPHLRAQGYSVDVMLSIFQTERNYQYIDCKNPEDFLFQNAYFGFNVHPYETLFVKSHRGIDDVMLEKLSKWQDMAGYSSYEVCRRV